MTPNSTPLITKLRWNLPWLVRYPFDRTRNFLGRNAFEKRRIIITIADHFEPSWSRNGLLSGEQSRQKLDAYHKIAQETGNSVIDSDGTKFRHTNFYPAEQYDRVILDKISQMQQEGLGEVEIHLHHGLETPDDSNSLRNALIEFRDRIAEDHRCLSRWDGDGIPRYAFVHGNLALSNSCGGRYCGVDEELKILAETGCYVDMTLPSAPDQSQVKMINSIYEITNPLDVARAHEAGKRLEVNGKSPLLPLIFTGPLVFNWTRRIKGVPIPRLDDGALVANQKTDKARFDRWLRSNITVSGRSEWVFLKLYCHGFFSHDQSASIGEDARRFFSEMIDHGERSGEYSVHFASAREAVNMVLAANDGKIGEPNDFRDYRLKSIMTQEAERSDKS